MLKDLYTSKRVTITQPDLNKILGSHERYVAKQGGIRALLRSANLDGLVLANRNLAEADLSGASLVGANLYGTNFSGASLYCADLRDCDLRNARLERADLRGASFKGANLAYAVLDYADIRAASMMYVGDTISIQGNAQLEAPFGAVNFSNCSLRNASFGNAKLDNVNFTNALMPGVIFRGAKLTNACFDGAVLIDVNLADLNVPPETLKNCLTSPSQAAKERAKEVLARIKAHHEWITSDGKQGAVAMINGEDLRPIGNLLKGFNLAGLCARNIIAVSVDFSGCQLQAAKFDGADLRSANFSNADLSGTAFDHAKLAHACFKDARIHDLTLHNGDVLQARANMAHGTSDQFSNANVRAVSFIAGLNN